ncbi:MAG: hypothetical protein ACRD1Y_11590 [Terriglobales bacterium]
MLAVGACSRVPVRSAAPEVVVVAGSGQLQAIGTQALSLKAQTQLGGRVAAGVVNPATHLLDLAVAGPAPAWLALDPATLRIRARRALGLQPTSIVYDAGGMDRHGSPRGTEYVAGANGSGGGRLIALDAATGRLRGQWTLPGPAVAMALTPARQLAVAISQPPELLLAEVPFRPLTGAGPGVATPRDPLHAWPGRGPGGPEPGSRVWRAVALDATPRQVVSLPYGHKVFVLCAKTVAAVNTQVPGLLVYLPLGEQPGQMVLKPDGGELYVSNAGGSVSVITTSANEVSGTIPAGLGAGAMAVTPDGTTLDVANAQAGTISVINLAARTVEAVIHVGQEPDALALVGGGALLFASDGGSNDVAVIRGRDPQNPNTLITLLPSPPDPGFLAVVRR